MHVERSWLAEWVDVPEMPVLSRALMEAGVEIEHVADASTHSEGVVVATVVEVAPHPQSERLHICRVSDGKVKHQVVCGAANVQKDMRVAYAPVGSRVGSVQLAPKAFRGVESAGMLCGREELGLPAVGDGLWALETTLGDGESIAPLLKQRQAFELGVTPNRADLLGHLGVAREIAAGSNLRLLPQKWRLHEAGPRAQTLCHVQLDAPERVRRYMGRVIQGVRVGPSPAWLSERLIAIGQRSVNNIVDITNYVMFDMGLPLHAFDLAKLHAGSSQTRSALPAVCVRMANANERIELLDGIERVLHEDDLVIADGDTAICLAGVMGGNNSHVTDATTDVFLEAAAFAAEGIGRSARRHGLRTEASYRFARGVDAATVQRALERAAQLMQDIAGGTVAKGAFDLQGHAEPVEDIVLRLSRVEQMLGVKLSKEAVVGLLEPLNIRCTKRTDGALLFAPPSFRPDLTREIDLIEEVARRHGLDNIPSRLPNLSLTERPKTRPSPMQRTGARAREALLAAGISETVHFAFASADALRPFAQSSRAPVTLLNPLGEEQRHLRTTLLPGLLGTVRRNLRRGIERQQWFEVGPVFWQPKQQKQIAHNAPAAVPTTVTDAVLPEERVHLACVLVGAREIEGPFVSATPVTSADIVGAWESLSAAYDSQAQIHIVQEQRDGVFNPLARARLELHRDGESPVVIGTLGQLDPAFVRGMEISRPVFAFEVDLGALEVLSPRAFRAKPKDKFPGTRRDLAVIAPDTLSAESIRGFLAAHATLGLRETTEVDVSIFDVYRGAHVPKGHVSLAFALKYKDAAGSLSYDDVAPQFARLLTDVAQAFGIEVRDGGKGQAS